HSHCLYPSDDGTAAGNRQSAIVKRLPGLSHADSTKDEGLHNQRRERTRSHPTADCPLPIALFIQLLENEQHAFCRPGGYCGVAAPVPIPNTAVKRPCANGTLS